MTGTEVNVSMASVAFFLCLSPLTLLRITPAIFTSGSNILNPRTYAAALLAKLLALITKMTGALRNFAISAVLPSSPTEVKPSYSPLTPSIMLMSESFEAHPNRFLIVFLSIKNESRFLDCLLHAKV